MIWVLVVLALIGGQPRQAMVVTDTEEHCKVAMVQVEKAAIAAGATQGGMECIQMKVGDLA